MHQQGQQRGRLSAGTVRQGHGRAGWQPVAGCQLCWPEPPQQPRRQECGVDCAGSAGLGGTPTAQLGSTRHGCAATAQTSPRWLLLRAPGPQVLMVALQRRPLFPGAITPVTVTDPAILKALEEMEKFG